MGNEVVFGIKLKADGSGFAGELRVSEEGMRRFARSAKEAGEQANKSFSSASQGIRSISQQLASLQRFTTGFTGFAVMGVGIREMVSGLFNAGVNSEKLFNTLKFGTGSAQAAARELDYVRRTADDLGLDLSSSAQAYAKLSAAANGTALSGQATRDIFTAVSKASTVMGLSAEETQGALLAISQMMSKGTVAAEELRGQLGERLPGAFQIAARAMGVTTAELGKMLENGEVMASTFLPRFAAELEKSLGNAPESAAQGAQAQLNRLNSEWTVFKENLANSGFLNVAAGALKTLAGGLKGIDFSDRARREDLWAKADRYQAEGYWQAYKETLREINKLDAEIEARRKRSESSSRADTSYADKESRRAASVLAAQDRTALAGYMGDAQRMSKAQLMQKALADEDKAFKAATANLDRNGAEYRQALERHLQAVSNIREKHTKDQKSLPDLLGEISGVSKDFNRDLATLKSAYDGGRMSLDEYRVAVEKLIERQPFAREELTRVTAAARVHNQEVDRELELEERRRQAVEHAIRDTRQMVEQMEFENTLIGLTNTARERAIVLREIEAKKTEMTAEAYEQLRARMEAALADREVRNKAASETAKIEADWKRTSENIERSLTDSLMRGFEGGKDAGRNALDALKNMFRTAVLQPLIKPIVEPVAQMASEAGRWLSNSLGDLFKGLLFNADGNAFGRDGVYAFAKGAAFGTNRVLTSPTPFLFSNGGAFSLGVAGEKTEEAVMPLARDSSGQLGVRSTGGGGGLQNVRVEIHNEGQPQEVASATPMFDPEGLVISIVMRDLRNNGPLRQAMTSTLGVRG